MNIKYLTLLLSFIFFGCNEPGPLVCPGNQELDECMVCGGPGPEYICEDGTYACNASSCPDNSFTNIGCMDPDAINYNPSATQELTCSCIYSDSEYIIDLGSLVLGTLTIFTTSICIPIYFINTSDTDITIITNDTDIPGCDGTTNTGSSCKDKSYSDCLNQLGCDWEIPPDYNPTWNNFTEEAIPAHTTFARYICDCSGPALAAYGIDNCDCDDIISEECEGLCICKEECSDCSLVGNQSFDICEELCISEPDECEELCIYEHEDEFPCTVPGAFPCTYTLGCYTQGEFEGTFQVSGHYSFYDKDNPNTRGLIVIE